MTFLQKVNGTNSYPVDEYTVLHWDFSEPSASVAGPDYFHDKISDALYLKGYRGTSYSAKLFGKQCVMIKNNYGLYTNDTSIGESQNFTFSGWFYPTGSSGATCIIMKNYNTGTGWFGGSFGSPLFYTFGGLTGKIEFTYNGGVVSANFSGGNSFLDYTWNYLTITCDGSSIKTYLNATLVDTRNSVTIFNWGNHGGWWVGTNPNDGGPPMAVADVRVDSIARDQTWVTNSYNMGKP